MNKEMALRSVSTKIRPTIIREVFGFDDIHRFLESVSSRKTLASSSRMSSDIEERQVVYWFPSMNILDLQDEASEHDGGCKLGLAAERYKTRLAWTL